MRIVTGLMAAGALLGGCAGGDPLAVDEAGAARAAVSPPDLIAVAEAMDARRGTQIGAGLTLVDARAEGDVLAFDLRHDQTASEFTPSTRDAFVVSVDRDFGARMCAAPATRSFVEEYGGVRATIVTQDGQPLASRMIDSCA